MSRRCGPGLQVLIGVAVVGLILYGFYSYREVKSSLRTMEEKADRLKVEHESVSAQLQVVYEHKTRLEKTVQEERTLHKKTKDELSYEKQNFEQQMKQERDESSKAETKNQQLAEELKNLHDSCEKQNELHQQQINQQRQECDNDVAQFKVFLRDIRMEIALQRGCMPRFLYDEFRPLRMECGSSPEKTEWKDLEEIYAKAFEWNGPGRILGHISCETTKK